MAELGVALLDPLADPLVRRAALEVALIGIVGGTLGCWVIHYRLAYAAESMAHSMLPGLVLAALAGVPLVFGGAAGLLVGAAAITAVARLPGVDREVAVAVAVTSLFGLGGLLALSAAAPPNVGAVLFGDILAVDSADLWVAAALVGVTLGALAILHPRLLAVGFDEGRALRTGMPVWAVEWALTALLAVAILVAVQGLGNLLAVASLVGPPAAARILARRMVPMMGVAVALGIASGIAGLYASFYLELAAGASIAGATVLVCGVALGGSRMVQRARAQTALPTLNSV